MRYEIIADWIKESLPRDILDSDKYPVFMDSFQGKSITYDMAINLGWLKPIPERKTLGILLRENAMYGNLGKLPNFTTSPEVVNWNYLESLAIADRLERFDATIKEIEESISEKNCLNDNFVIKQLRQAISEP